MSRTPKEGPRGPARGLWYEPQPSGKSKRRTTPEYRAWLNMRNRCNNTRCPDYRYYGGRGISVCPEWGSFAQFLCDVGPRPGDLYTLDRVDSDGNYEPSNCRWATRRTQARNRAYASTKAWILAERLGVAVMTAHHRIWQLRNKHSSAAPYFNLSPELERKVAEFLEEAS